MKDINIFFWEIKMKITELIEKLSNIKENYGNLEVVFHTLKYDVIIAKI